MMLTYSLHEANDLLKLVRVIAAEMLERRSDRRRLARNREQLEVADTPEGLRKELAELDARIWEHDDVLRSCKIELEDLGLTVLRTNPLTVHIPGRSLPTKAGRTAKTGMATHVEGTAKRLLSKGRDRNGTTEVVFCWQEGESSVCFGHPMGEEEHQRRPLRVAKGA
jgi:hypothetical protein